MENQCWNGCESRTASAYHQGARLRGVQNLAGEGPIPIPTPSSQSQGMMCLRTQTHVGRRSGGAGLSSPGPTHHSSVTFHNHELCRPRRSLQGVLKYRLLQFVIHFGPSAFIQYQSFLQAWALQERPSRCGWVTPSNCYQVGIGPATAADRWGWGQLGRGLPASWISSDCKHLSFHQLSRG